MRVAAISGWREALSGFWFIPGLVATAIAALSFPLVAIDDRFTDLSSSVGFGGDDDAARDLLAVIAGSLITVAGLAFSVTMVTLQLVASQFSPRALRGLLADRPNQVVVGIFVGVFAYCLLVMRSVRGAENGEAFVPGLSVSVAILLALVTLAALIFFIHHVGQMVQVSEITGKIGRRALVGIRAFAADEPETSSDPLERWREQGEPARCHVGRAGFVQSVDLERIVECLRCEADVRVHVPIKPGDFVTETDTIIEAWPAERVRDALGEAPDASIVVADERHDAQDPGYPLRLLSDIALRALSPSMNDPTTAVTAIGYLRAALEAAAASHDPSRVVEYADERTTVVASRWAFDDLLTASVEELAGKVDMHAVDALLDALDSIAEVAAEGPHPERADAVSAFRRRVRRLAPA